MSMVDEFTIVDINLDDTIPCQGRDHALGVGGHVAESPAEYRITTPCCGAQINQCAGRVGRLLAEWFIRCGVCSGRFTVNELGVRKL